MLKSDQRSPRKRPFDWLLLGVAVIFALVLLAAGFVFFTYSRSRAASAPTPGLSILPTANPTLTATAAPSLQPPSPSPSPTLQIYLVKSGDTLYSIALQFGVTVDALRAANALSTDLIFPDQQLVIPVSQSVAASPATAPPEALATPGTSELIRYQVQEGDTLESIAASRGLVVSDLRAANAMVGDALITGQFITLPSEVPVPAPAWKFSATGGDFSRNYPLALDTERFTLHYQPGTFPAQDPAALARLELNGLAFLESATGLRLGQKYDVYVAGSNFEPPNRALRGITFSSALKTFFLQDGTGNAADQQYIAAHELTHLFMWNTVGSPASTMLSEGTAVYAGMEVIAASGHIPLEAFCAAYLQAGALPNPSGSLTFLGHIADLENYYASGCFVKYLADTYGMQSLVLVYHSGDYAGVYGKNLAVLENEWRDHLSTVPVPAEFSPTELTGAVRDVEGSYATFFSGFTGSPAQLEAYRELDRARIALLQGNLPEMRASLEAFNQLR